MVKVSDDFPMRCKPGANIIPHEIIRGAQLRLSYPGKETQQAYERRFPKHRIILIWKDTNGRRFANKRRSTELCSFIALTNTLHGKKNDDSSLRGVVALFLSFIFQEYYRSQRD